MLSAYVTGFYPCKICSFTLNSSVWYLNSSPLLLNWGIQHHWEGRRNNPNCKGEKTEIQNVGGWGSGSLLVAGFPEGLSIHNSSSSVAFLFLIQLVCSFSRTLWLCVYCLLFVGIKLPALSFPLHINPLMIKVHIQQQAVTRKTNTPAFIIRSREFQRAMVTGLRISLTRTATQKRKK